MRVEKGEKVPHPRRAISFQSPPSYAVDGGVKIYVTGLRSCSRHNSPFAIQFDCNPTGKFDVALCKSSKKANQAPQRKECRRNPIIS